MSNILVVGSVALDSVKTPFGERKEILGGSATYFSVAASHFAPVSLVAVVGEDFPRKYIELLKGKKVDTAGLEIAHGETFRWSGEYSFDFNDRKTIFTHLNVFADFKPKVPQIYQDKDFLFLANIDPQLQLDVLRQVNQPKLIACDTMNLWIEVKPKVLRELLRHVDIFFLNEPEARQLTGKSNLAKAAADILKMGPSRVIIKKGEHGALMFARNSVFCVPAYLLENVIDPTGAGDTFAGGVVGYLARCGKVNEANLRNALVYGSVMATFAVEAFSLDKLARVTKADIKARLAQFKKFTCF